MLFYFILVGCPILGVAFAGLGFWYSNWFYLPAIALVSIMITFLLTVETLYKKSTKKVCTPTNMMEICDFLISKK
tara:strand:- start:8290 stop:8514 length:225 start_codon:yes stop_codon:yes gene_type:complete